MRVRDTPEVLRFRVTVVDLSFAARVIFAERGKERENEEDEAHQGPSHAYDDALKIVHANAGLRLRTAGALPNPTPEHNERMLVIFDMPISLVERAGLVAIEPRMSPAGQRRRNPWRHYVSEWVRREDFANLLPALQRGEDPEFRNCIQRVVAEERGTPVVASA
jgi:hypothetical protein